MELASRNSPLVVEIILTQKKWISLITKTMHSVPVKGGCKVLDVVETTYGMHLNLSGKCHFK